MSLSRGRRSGLVALLVLAAACEDETRPAFDGGMPVDSVDAGRLSCLEVETLFVGRVYGDPTLIALRACTVDSDCRALSTVLVCPAPIGSKLEYCDTPIARTGFDGALDWLHSQEIELCPRITPGCRSISDCDSPGAHCIDHVCSRLPNNLAADGGLR